MSCKKLLLTLGYFSESADADERNGVLRHGSRDSELAVRDFGDFD